jgi:hypothetical protein
MSDGYRGGDPRMVKLAELWERTSARGTRYFSGFMGDAQVLLFDGGEKAHPTRAGETVHVWRLMVQERDPARRPQARRSEAEPERELRPRPEPSLRSGGTAAPNAPAKPSASPVARGDGWRGSQYRRPANGAQRGATADSGTFYDDDLTDIGR